MALFAMPLFAMVDSAIATPTSGSAPEVGNRAVFRVVDVGKAGTPQLRRDQLQWLKLIALDNFWGPRIASLWFAPLPGRLRPLIVFYGFTKEETAGGQIATQTYPIVGDCCDVRFVRDLRMSPLQNPPQGSSAGPCIRDPMAPDQPLVGCSPPVVFPNVPLDKEPSARATVIAQLHTLVDQVMLGPKLTQDLQQYRPIFRVTNKRAVLSLSAAQSNWLQEVLSNDYWGERAPHLWFSPISSNRRPLIIFYDGKLDPHNADIPFYIVGENCALAFVQYKAYAPVDYFPAVGKAVGPCYYDPLAIGPQLINPPPQPAPT